MSEDQGEARRREGGDSDKPTQGAEHSVLRFLEQRRRATPGAA